MRGLASFFLASPLLESLSAGVIDGDTPMEDLINVFDFAKAAEAKLDPVAFAYMAEGGKDEVSLRDARRAFDRILIRPRFLTAIDKIDLTTSFLGKDMKFPIFVDPAGGKECFRTNGELETAKGAAAAGAMYISNGGIDDFLVSQDAPDHWWLYTTGRNFSDENAMLDFVEKVEDMGGTGICFTVDNMFVSHRERSIHNKFVRTWCNTGIPRDDSGDLIYKPGDQVWTTGNFPELAVRTPTWEDLKKMRDMTDLPIMLKGILTREDTELAVSTGMDAIVVSSHGARQLDHVGGPIEALPECVDAASGRMPVLIDGGFRRGTDVLKALALGATAVGVARPYLWGLTTYGAQGVARVLELLRTELALDMGMTGVARVQDIQRSHVRFRDYSL